MATPEKTTAGLGTAERVLVTGGAGFVGTHVVERLAAQGVPLRVLVRDRGLPPLPGAEVVQGDLTNPETLRGLCEGTGTLLHLAARIGGSEEDCRAVNETGTRALLAEAERAGVRRIVQLGTAAVYRNGAHRGAAEGELPEEPGSVTSATRLAGERLVLAAGGTVVRPHLVYGRGDRWVVPELVRMLRRLPYWVDGGRARMSMISVDALAGALAELAVRSDGRGDGTGGRVLHAAHPEPVTAREVVETIAGALGLALPTGDTDLTGALELLGAAADADAGVGEGEGEGDRERAARTARLRRLLSLLAVDHWYDGSKLWSELETPPGPRFTEGFGTYAPWYGPEVLPRTPATR
ncbi:NAD-dependent epimerase/dehydratase family protein [Streptomyces sp. NPDC048603]|uniref:NAD-dependent epimerase/dehydratase family protein n=1 Tax=Streptomyces sp. NPDC048603 TaxID=3365577 RepID=UPI003718E79E